MPSPISFSRPARLLGDDHGDLVEVLLIVQIGLQQRILGLLHDVGHRVGIHRLAFFIVRISLAAAIAAGDAGLAARLLRAVRRNGGQRQPQRKARGRQNSRKALHSGSPEVAPIASIAVQ